jgi:hypothetical protein
MLKVKTNKKRTSAVGFFTKTRGTVKYLMPGTCSSSRREHNIPLKIHKKRKNITKIRKVLLISIHFQGACD